MPNIGIIGMGYVGLCTAVCFAARGLDVVGIDIDTEKVSALNNGEVAIFEKGLEEYLCRAISRDKISFSTDHNALRGTDYVFVSVGTPGLPNGNIDLSQILTASRRVGSLLSEASGYRVVVVKSTVLPGTSATVVRPLLEKLSGKRAGEGFGLCSNPEFLREGSAINDTLHPDKIVIGAEDDRSGQKLAELYNGFYGEERPPVVRTNLSTAELIKYSNNAFLAMKISYINTIAKLCEGIEDTDVRKVAEAIGLDSRIGPKFLDAGPGYGGSCFPKDLKALIAFAKKVGVEHGLLEATHSVNANQARHVALMAKKLLGSVRRKKVAVLGLAFKAHSDDIREAASLRLVNHLLKMGASIRVYDPRALERVRLLYGDNLDYASSAEDCVRGADIAIIMAEWPEFKALKPRDFLRMMKKPAVLDARRVFNPGDFIGKVNFAAVGFGSQSVSRKRS